MQGPQRIKLYTFAYKFISNIYHLDANAPISDPRVLYTHLIETPNLALLPLESKQAK